MNNARRGHVSPNIYFREIDRTNIGTRQFSAKTTKIQEIVSGGGGGTPTPPVPPTCTESSSYTISNVSYPLTVEYSATSNTIAIDYILTVINSSCETSTTMGSDTIIVEFEANTNAEPRTIVGSVEYQGNVVNYEFTQEGLPIDDNLFI